MREATGICAADVTLHLGVDQVGSVRVLATAEGLPVKCVEYDSFGNVIGDKRPALRFSLGFACGLNDPHIGFVRFRFWDYHPLIDRFTAKDPAMEMRGDGDLWDYCVDDPVSCCDLNGLWTLTTFDELRVTRDERGKFVAKGSGGMGRQLGLGTGAVIDGMANVLDTVAFPARKGLNYANGLLGGDLEYFTPLQESLTDSLGLPKPETEQERFNYHLQEGVASILTAGVAAGTQAGGAVLEAVEKGLGSAPGALRGAEIAGKNASRRVAAGLATLGKCIKGVPTTYTDLARKGGVVLATQNLDKPAQQAAELLEGAFVPVISILLSRQI